MSEKSSRKKMALSQRLIRNERGGGRWGDDEGMLLREWIQKESTFNEWGRGNVWDCYLGEPSNVMSWKVKKNPNQGGVAGRGGEGESGPIPAFFLKKKLLQMQGKRDKSSSHLVFRSDKIWFNSLFFGCTEDQQEDGFWNLKRNLNSYW